jgi:anthranilate phosphoribosyltransferase
MLGPMVNPAFPKKQIVGVFSLDLARVYGYLYQNSDKEYKIVHSLDGYDEISLTADFKIVDKDGERIVSPEEVGFGKISPESISGGNSIEESAKIFEKILKGEGTEAQNNVAISNAGLALQCGKNLSSLEEGIDMARESLESGNALHSFKIFLQISNGNAR